MISFQPTLSQPVVPLKKENIYGIVRNEKTKAYTERLNQKYRDGLLAHFKGPEKRPYQQDKKNFFSVAMFSLNGVTREKGQKIQAQHHTGIINLDLDENTQQELQQFRGHLPEIPYLEFCALSVSGMTTGHLWANILVEIPKTWEHVPETLQERFPKELWVEFLHKAYIEYVTDDFQRRFHIMVGSSKDLKRARYLGFDKSPYHNTKAICLPMTVLVEYYKDKLLPEQRTAPPQPQHPTQRTVSNPIRKAALEALKSYDGTHFDDRERFVNFCMACKYEGLSYADIDHIFKRSKGYNYEENLIIFEGLRPNGSKTFGSVVRLAKEYSPDTFKTRKKYHKAAESPNNDDDKSLGVAARMSLFLAKRYKLSYNIVTSKIQVDGVPMTDPIWSRIYCEMVDAEFKNAETLKQVLLRDASRKAYHPIHKYFYESKWDGVERLNEECLSVYFEDIDGIFWYLLRKWMIGAISKAFTGAQNPMLVLAGDQEAGKSVFSKWLCPIKGMYLDTAIQPDNKDDNLRLTDRFVWEVSEVGSTTRRQDIDALKAFLTREVVTVRRSYDKFDIDRPALSSFIGTINPDGVGFLNDTTGNRRFRVCQIIKLDWAYSDNLNIHQLWAEAYQLFKNGEDNRLPIDVKMIMQERMAESFEFEDPVEQHIHNCYILTGDEENRVKTTDVLCELREDGYRGNNTKAESMAVARTMRRINVDKIRTAHGRFYIGLRPRAQHEKT